MLAACQDSVRKHVESFWREWLIECGGDVFPDSIVKDPSLGVCIDGRRRAQHQAESDWISDGMRVQCKSAQLCATPDGRWRFHFRNVKLHLSNELVLVGYAPECLLVMLHDFQHGVASAGSQAVPLGHHVILQSASKSAC